MTQRWLLLPLALLGGLAQAKDDTNGCTPAIEKALRAVDPKAVISGKVASRQCKPWPGDSTQTAAVMAFEHPGQPDEGRDWTVVVALLDTATQRVVSSHTGEAGEDATTSVDTYSFTLDTARYQLSPTLRALGVRFRSASNGSPVAEAWSGNELTLFAPEGRALRPVFTQPMSAQQSDVCCLSRQFAGAVWRNAEMTLSIGPAAATGWNDLIVTETTVHDGNPPATFDKTPHKRQYVYRYVDKAYQLQAKPAPFWSGDSGTVAW